MNRSLEALAIFTICLGGILAAVRISSKDQVALSRNMAEEKNVPAVPAKASSSATEQSEEEGWQFANSAPSGCLAFEHGCGLDRGEGRVYSAFPPLVSPAAFVRSAIRSAPLPVFVLPDESAQLEASATGYDAAYDAAVLGYQKTDTFSYDEMAAEYAAAELAAAGVDDKQGSFSSDFQSAGDFAAWQSLHSRWQALSNWSSSQVAHYDFAYLAPARRAFEMRWSMSLLPKMLNSPKVRSEARRQLLLRQRAGSAASDCITWDDYLAFADRRLADRHEATTSSFEPALSLLQQSSQTLADYCQLAESLLHQAGQQLQRVARHENRDTFWSPR
ncbi:hypothetical protein ETAA8_51810 [Anatilimnocola aggregata]|uniref:Uncharacterized protein n=1 Tax=Anatilimnocola aggregata TaxID=2528021 RepID=A0A517YIM3_9BACT|nr:hypothetical protein [Anatilimnocola aggregata]QDU30062.1 hypothetical protein ETAA8_51810 [Anatilimnocola aggregata]